MILPNSLRRYAEPLLDILIAGGVLAPGGGKVEGTAVSSLSVFMCEPMVEAVRGHLLVTHHIPSSSSHTDPTLPLQVMNRLLQRYKYLKKGLEEEMKKILKFLKAFEDSERRSLAIYTGLLLAEVLVPASVLSSLLRCVIHYTVIFMLALAIVCTGSYLGACMCVCPHI